MPLRSHAMVQTSSAESGPLTLCYVYASLSRNCDLEGRGGIVRGVNASRLVLSAMKYRVFEAITISLAVELYTAVIRRWLQRPIQSTSR